MAKPGTCFEWSEKYIGSDKGQFKNDITIIEDDNGEYIDTKQRLYGLYICTALKDDKTVKKGQLNGIKLVLSNGDRTDDILLNSWGNLFGQCEYYIT